MMVLSILFRLPLVQNEVVNVCSPEHYFIIGALAFVYGHWHDFHFHSVMIPIPRVIYGPLG